MQKVLAQYIWVNGEMPMQGPNWNQDFAGLWSTIAQELCDYRSELDRMSVGRECVRTVLEEELRTQFSFDAPMSFDEAVRSVTTLMKKSSLHATNPRYFGLFVPDTMPASVAADALAAAFNPQLAAWGHAPAANEIERHVLRVFQQLLGHGDPSCAAHFTSGGSEANHSAVVCAMVDRFPDVERTGLHGFSGSPKIYVSSQAHHSVRKIAVACGLGSEGIVEIAVDERQRMLPKALHTRIAEDRAAGDLPFMVIATAGTTGTGTIDPLVEVAEVCAEERLWLHVDAAYGGAFLLSTTASRAMSGIDRADSVTIDAHKGLFVSMGAGMFFCRHQDVARRAFATQANYMPAPTDGPDLFQNSMQWSRRFIGLKLFLTLATLGLVGCRELLDTQCNLADVLRNRLILDGWQIHNDTPLPVVCFSHPEVDSAELVRRVVESGEAWISTVETTYMKIAIRACITNYRTEALHIEHLVNHLNLARSRPWT